MIEAFLFWRNMRALGFKSSNTIELILLVMGIGALVGWFVNPSVALFCGLLAFFWYCNRQKWSVWEVGDQAAISAAIGYLSLTIYYLYSIRSGIATSLVLLTTAAALILLNLFLFNKRGFKGYRLFLTLTLISVVLMVNSSLSLTFLVATLLLSLFAMVKRLKLKSMAFSLDFINNLKHRLLDKKRVLTEQQLKLPQDDPFFVAGRADSNSPEEDADEQVGHLNVLAQESFLGESQKQVDKALEKMGEGTYGVCEKCGAEIESGRLEVTPEATLCVKCAA